MADTPSTAEDLTTLTRRIVRFRDERDWAQFHTPRNLAMALSVEAGELLEAYLWAPDDAPVDAANSREEVADVLIYALLLCHALGIDPAAAIVDKLEKNAAKYPVETARGRSTKYDRL